MKFNIWKLLELCIDFIYPPRCLDCGVEGFYSCSSCTKKLKPHSESCPTCHTTSPHYQICIACKAKERIKGKKSWSQIEGILINFQYTPLAKALVYQLKYNHAASLAKVIGQKIWLLISTHPLMRSNKSIAISYVPSHRIRKHRVKGYNQSELIARKVANDLHLPLIKATTRTRHTKSQVKLSRKKRFSNLKRAFSIHPDSWKQLNEIDTLIIVDDITTTGSTLIEVARCIKKQHPRIKIRGAVFARHGV